MGCLSPEEATGKQIKDAVLNDPAGVAGKVADAVVKTGKDILNDPSVLLPEGNHGEARDQQLVAELQGDKDKAQQEAGSQFISDVTSLGVPLAGGQRKKADWRDFD